jgi:arylsulfatase A-like enzyme
VYHFALGPSYDGPVRHVILLSLDTTRKDHFGCYGNQWIRTPRIDALAAESILFRNHLTVAPSTLASHVSLFTGKYPHTHGTPRNGFTVNPQNVTLTELLRETGFYTAAFIASFALDSRFGLSQGFDHYDQVFDRLVPHPSQSEYQDQRSARAVTDAVIRHLDARGVSQNLFLFVHYFDPHTPYAPPPSYERLYAQASAVFPESPPDLNGVRRRLAQGGGGESPAARALAARYAGEISFMDEQVGRLLDYLEPRGILDESILIVTSNHGENFWEHPDYFNHGLTLYQPVISAVCMMRLPGATPGHRTVERPTASIDVLPTLLQYLGLPIPAGVEGQAIDIEGSSPPGEPVVRFSEATKPSLESLEPRTWANQLKARCVRRGTLKYIRTPYASREELYDLATDPLEQHNLLHEPTPEAVAEAAELRELLAAWSRSADPLSSSFECNQLEETLNRLRSLGYAR